MKRLDELEERIKETRALAQAAKDEAIQRIIDEEDKKSRLEKEYRETNNYTIETGNKMINSMMESISFGLNSETEQVFVAITKLEYPTIYIKISTASKNAIKTKRKQIIYTGHGLFEDRDRLQEDILRKIDAFIKISSLLLLLTRAELHSLEPYFTMEKFRQYAEAFGSPNVLQIDSGIAIIPQIIHKLEEFLTVPGFDRIFVQQLVNRYPPLFDVISHISQDKMTAKMKEFIYGVSGVYKIIVMKPLDFKIPESIIYFNQRDLTAVLSFFTDEALKKVLFTVESKQFQKDLKKAAK